MTPLHKKGEICDIIYKARLYVILIAMKILRHSNIIMKYKHLTRKYQLKQLINYQYICKHTTISNNKNTNVERLKFFDISSQNSLEQFEIDTVFS